MIFFLPGSHFAMVVVFKCIEQTRHQDSMWDTRMFSSLESPWGLKVMSAFSEGRVVQSV